MNAHQIFVMVNYDGDPYAVAHTEAERDRLLDMDDGTGEPDNYWVPAWCYESHPDLAALPPSFMVDGRVVELEEVVQHLERTGHGFVVAKVEYRAMLDAVRQTIAAREVAE